MGYEPLPTVLELPVLPLRREVLFPGMLLTLTADPAVMHVLERIETDGWVGAVLRRAPDEPARSLADVHAIGTVARVRSLVRLSSDDDCVIVTLQGLRRMLLAGQVHSASRIRAQTHVLQQAHPDIDDPETRAAHDALRSSLDERAIRWRELFDPETLARSEGDPAGLADIAAATMLPAEGPCARQRMLETLDVAARVQWLLRRLGSQTAGTRSASRGPAPSRPS